MVDNITLGRRIKQCRQALGFTLKVLEGKAGVSATHISEIERGRTSPTIGALEKLAGALERDLAYFVETTALEDMEVLRAAERRQTPLPAGMGRHAALSAGIPGSKLSARVIDLTHEGVISLAELAGGEDVYYVEAGAVRFEVDGKTHDLKVGDSIHLRAGVSYRYVGQEREGARLFHFSAERPSMLPPRRA